MHGGKEYDASWHKRMRGEGPYADMIAQRFAVAVKRMGLGTSAAPMRHDLFRAPVMPGAQMSLF
jgi:hypothetical protein